MTVDTMEKNADVNYIGDSDEEVDEEKALRRATIEKLYSQKQESKSQNSEIHRDDSKKTISSIYTIMSVLYNPRNFGEKITDVETDPDVPNNISKAADLDFSDIDKVRFVLENGDKTIWYKWDGSKLKNIINYYSNGDISTLLSGKKINYTKENGDIEINMPNKFNSRTSRIKKEINDRIQILRTKNEFESINMAEFVSMVLFYISSLIVLITYNFVGIGIAFGVSVIVYTIHLMIGAKLDSRFEYTHDPVDHYKSVIMPVLVPILFLYNKLDKIQ